jgi:hypothetical protein
VKLAAATLPSTKSLQPLSLIVQYMFMAFKQYNFRHA